MHMYGASSDGLCWLDIGTMNDITGDDVYILGEIIDGELIAQ